MSTRLPTSPWRAEYTVVEAPPELRELACVVIQDVGSARGCRSVTNDVEAIVAELEQLRLLGSRRLFYFDSVGELDEIVHDCAGGFLRFAPGPRAGNRPVLEQLASAVTSLEHRWTGSDAVSVMLADAQVLEGQVRAFPGLLVRVEHFIGLCQRNLRNGGPL